LTGGGEKAVDDALQKVRRERARQELEEINRAQ